MGIVSYAQNFEDVMLWRALGGAGPGFWIDVGASDPTLHSVTRAFHERGWRGINVEPSLAEFAALAATRPDDINLCLALAATPGEMTFYDCECSGLSSLDPDAAARNRAAGRRVAERRVEVSTLAAICARHAPADIHFLKIDVEGAERQVLQGADFAAFRPWIVLVEATIPLTSTDASAEWEGLVLGAGYRFAYFDGLNRFYLAEERWEQLAPHFAAPPNVFDGFRLADAPVPTEEAIRQRRTEAELALLRYDGMPQELPRGHPLALPWRLARRVRQFLSAELRAELAVLRQDHALLSRQMDMLLRQLRP